MIMSYHVINGVVRSINLRVEDSIPASTVWIDLVDPTTEEQKMLRNRLNINIPSKEDIDRFELKSTFHSEGEAYYMTVTTLYRDIHGHVEASPLTCILTKSILITLRHSHPLFFSNCVSRLMKRPDLCANPERILEEMVSAFINTIADVLQLTGNEMDTLLHSVFDQSISEKERNHRPANYYNTSIKKIGKIGDVISKNRESLINLNRMLLFYNQIRGNLSDLGGLNQRFINLAREVDSLGEYAVFLAQRNSFLLDATLGLLSSEQNNIIKVFTVAAAAFMPPTTIASIYGMNFKDMPELTWQYGYIYALAIMAASAVVPYLYLRYKRWL